MKKIKLSTKTKVLIFLIGILLLEIISAFFTGRELFSYVARVLKGEYQTCIEVTKPDNDASGNYTIFIDGKYFFYDPEKKGIFDYQTKEEIIHLSETIYEIATNGNYIYCWNQENLYQYNVSGELVAQIKIGEGRIFVGTENVYFWENDTGWCYILSAENIKNAGENIQENDQAFSVQDEKIRIGIETADGYIGWNEMDDTEEMNITYAPEYVRIEAGGVFVLAKDTGKEMLGAGFERLGLFNDEFYAGDYYGDYNGADIIIAAQDEAYAEVEGTKNSKSKTNYSNSVKDGKYLIVLSTKYTPGGFTSYDFYTSGSVGEYDESRLYYLDLEQKKVVKEYELTDEMVIYMSAEKYATIKEGTVTFYDAMTGEVIKSETVEGYQVKEIYHVEVCGEKIFFYCNGSMLDCIDI